LARTGPAIAVQVEAERARAGQHHLAEPRGDHAAVLHTRRNQRDQAAFGHADLALVDDARAGPARQVEAQLAGHEVFVARIGGRQHQCGRVEPRVAPDEDAVLVDQVNAPVGRERAQQRGGFVADHAVERGRHCRGLLEAHRLARPNAEALPVNHGARRGLLDLQGARNRLRDRGLPRGDHATGRIGLRRHRA
jgi:hypothetical protein